jgi:hypothetical protein
MISRNYRGLIRTALFFSFFLFIYSFYTRNKDDYGIAPAQQIYQAAPSRQLLLFIGLSSPAINHPLRTVQREIFQNRLDRDEVTIKFLVDVDEDMSIARKELLNFEVDSCFSYLSG